MFEFIGLIIGLTLLCGLSVVAGGLLGAVAWLLFWGRKRPKLLILALAATPLASVVYIVACALCMEIVVPDQPDLFFGDFSEPLPHGYVLTGLGKMPEFSYIDSTPSMIHQPSLRGGIRRLELNGEVVYGAYGHIEGDNTFDTNHDHGYFVFDTRTGTVTNVATMEQLDDAAGHRVNLVQSQFFRSQDPRRIWLRRIEDLIFFAPPSMVLLALLTLVARRRIGRNSFHSDVQGLNPQSF